MIDLMPSFKCCPVDNTFRIVGKKFTIHILRNMMILGQKRFNQFLDSVEGINPNTLSTRLREMEQSSLIVKNVFNGTPVRIEYSLTEKGLALRPILEAMADYSMQYCCGDVFVDGKPRTFKQVFGNKMDAKNS